MKEINLAVFSTLFVILQTVFAEGNCVYKSQLWNLKIRHHVVS